MTHEEFIALVAPLHDDMYRLAAAVTGSPDDAADVVQDTMLSLWKARSSIPPPPRLAAYAFTALRNKAISAVSRRWPADNLPPADPADPTRCDDPLSLSETRRTLHSLIDALPDTQRTVMRLTAFGGCDTARTALLTGLSEANVRQALSRARRSLRNSLTLLNK